MISLNKIFLGSLCALSLLPLHLSARTWTSSDGNKTFTGEFKKFDSGSKQVTITRTNGRSTTFSIDKLSEADQKWIIESEAAKATKAAEDDVGNLEEQLEAQPVAQNIYKDLTQLNKGKLKKAEFQFAPEYYLLYFSASW